MYDFVPPYLICFIIKITSITDYTLPYNLTVLWVSRDLSYAVFSSLRTIERYKNYNKDTLTE